MVEKIQKAYDIVKKQLRAVLLANYDDATKNDMPNMANAYKNALMLLQKQNHLKGFDDSWMSDAFATAFSESRGCVSRDLYDELYDKMFK